MIPIWNPQPLAKADEGYNPYRDEDGKFASGPGGKGKGGGNIKVADRFNGLVQSSKTITLAGLSGTQIDRVVGAAADLSARAKKLGIPPIKTIKMKPGKIGPDTAPASMGADGTLYLTDLIFTGRSSADTLDTLYEQNMQTLSHFRKIAENGWVDPDNGNKYNKREQTRWLKVLRQIALDTKNIDAMRKTNGIHSWSWKNSGGARPSTVVDFVDSGVGRDKVVMDHEFGHHLVNNVPGLDKKVFRAYIEASRTRPFCASTYGETNGNEWFAENYALQTNGREDLVHPLLKPIMKELV